MRFLRYYRQLWPGMAALFLLVAGRMACTHSLRFAFLGWNFFLALIPLCCSYRVAHMAKPPAAWVLAALWLLFFPNAAYLFTDIVHLRPGTGLLYWLDVVILFSSGIYGLVIAMYSLRDMEAWYSRWVTPAGRACITALLLLLCGYGLYLGRVERWNSWDVIAQPQDLFGAVRHHIRHPFRSRDAWGMTVLFAIGLRLIYGLFQQQERPAL